MTIDNTTCRPARGQGPHAIATSMQSVRGARSPDCALCGVAEKPALALLTVPPAAVVCGLTYGFAFAVQRLGSSEMDELRTFVDDVICSSAPLPSGVRNRIPETALTSPGREARAR